MRLRRDEAHRRDDFGPGRVAMKSKSPYSLILTFCVFGAGVMLAADKRSD